MKSLVFQTLVGMALVLVTACAGPAKTPVGAADRAGAESSSSVIPPPAAASTGEAPATPGHPEVVETPTEEVEVRPLPQPPALPPTEAVPEVVPETRASPAPVPIAPQPKEIIADHQPRSFEVRAGEKDPSHPFYGVGHKIGLMVNGLGGRELVLTRGVTYTFNVDTGVQHDFYFSTSPVGWGTGTYTDGVQGQFTYQGEVTMTPGANTPDVLYYQCRNHKSMGGKIHVVERGTKVVLGQMPAATADTTSAAPASTVTEAQVKQKLSYASMLMGADLSKRIAAGGQAEAQLTWTQAQEKLTAARAASGAGQWAQAMALTDEALRLAMSANQLAQGQGQDEARYKVLHHEVQNLSESYQRAIKQSPPKSGQGMDEAKFKALIKEAETQAAAGQYTQAHEALLQAREMVAAVLLKITPKTVVYEKTFATPKEEYEHELARYKSYEELIPLAIEQRQPAPGVVELMQGFVTKAKGIVEEGQALAAKGDYKMAIMAMQAASENMERALRLAGVQ